MSTTVAVLEAKLSADTRDFDRAMGRSDSRMKSVAKTAGKAGLAGAVLGLGAAVKIGFSEFMEAQKVTAQTNAVIKSTGGAANVTTNQVNALATSLMKKSGVDDEVIASGENMLLTFTKIRNEVGVGNDIFNQATKATLDLSVAMGKDMQSSAILVGKALNDPIKGMTALNRAGIQFTADQKETITTLVESGRTMDAQKLILKELETQFGGSAEAAGKTFSGQINIARQTVNNFLGDIVERAIPTLIAMKDTVVNNWPRIREVAVGVFGWMQENVFPIVGQLRDIFVETVQRMRQVMDNNGPEIRTILNGIGTAIQAIAKVAVPILDVAFTEVLPRLIEIQIKLWAGLFTVIDKVVDAIRWIGDKAGPLVSKMWEVAKKPLEDLADTFRAIARVIERVVDGVRWLIDNVGRIPKPSLPDLNPFGDPRDPRGTGPTSISSSLWDELAGARRFGLTLTSGYRPGAITANGTPSDHGVYPSKAIDVAGSPASMAGFFRWLIGQSDVKQAFYDPLGSIFGGILSSYREGGHSDHVHVATYDQGGYLRPGWNLAYNGLGRPEPVGGGTKVFNFELGGRGIATLVWDELRQKATVYERQNGRPAFGTS